MLGGGVCKWPSKFQKPHCIHVFRVNVLGVLTLDWHGVGRSTGAELGIFSCSSPNSSKSSAFYKGSHGYHSFAKRWCPH